MHIDQLFGGQAPRPSQTNRQRARVVLDESRLLFVVVRVVGPRLPGVEPMRNEHFQPFAINVVAVQDGRQHSFGREDPAGDELFNLRVAALLFVRRVAGQSLSSLSTSLKAIR